MKNTIRALALAGLVTTLASHADADVVLSGPDNNDGSYSTSALSAAANGGDTVNSGGLTGISLWGFLGGANASSPTSPVYGAITTSTPAGDNGKNAILRYYLVASNATGQQSVVSLGEIDPNFGGTAASPAFLAYKNTGGSLLSQPELVVPGAAGRDLNNVTSLALLAAPAASGSGGVSTAVTLSGDVNNPGSYTEAQLAGDFSPVTETVSGDTYTGVALWAFLDPSGSSTNQIVVTQGTDGYEVVLSLAELDPSLGAVACGVGVNNCDLLPYEDTSGNFPADGVARTILPADNAHGRWESNLEFVSVEEVPEPGMLAPLVMAMFALGSLRRRVTRR